MRAFPVTHRPHPRAAGDTRRRRSGSLGVSAVKVLVGLGNPGSEYDKTRHNAGFLVIDRLARRHGASQIPKARFHSVCFEVSVMGEKCLLLKPTTFMNRSGVAVAEALAFYKLDPAADLLVIVDDVYLNAGVIRVRPSGSAGGHNGLADVQRALGSEAYPRLRVGVDPKPSVMALHDYVLGRFTPEQQAAVEPALNRAADACETFATRGLSAAMNAFNTGEIPPSPNPPTRTPHPPTPLPPSHQDQKS